MHLLHLWTLGGAFYNARSSFLVAVETALAGHARSFKRYDGMDSSSRDTFDKIRFLILLQVLEPLQQHAHAKIAIVHGQ